MESSTNTQEDRDVVGKEWALWFTEAKIPFSAASSRNFEIAIEVSCQYGSGYKPPTPYELSGSLLDALVVDTRALRKQHEEAWKQYGCTLLSDGWTDRRGRHLINFLVNSPEGTYFIESCYFLSMRWFSLEEERVMQQSRVSISLGLRNQGINPVGDSEQVTEYLHTQSTTCTQREKGVVNPFTVTCKSAI